MKIKRTVGNVQLMQKINRLQVLRCIRRYEPVSRPAVAEETGLSLSSITNIVNYLMERRLVRETGVEEIERVGRKAALLRFDGGAYRLLCVYVERDSATIDYTDLSGEVCDREVVSIEGEEPPALFQTIKAACRTLLDRHPGEQVLGIGFAVSGLILEESNYILSASLRWKAFHVKRDLESSFDIPVFIENVSVTRAVWQLSREKQGGKGRNVIFFDLDKGVGAVQLIDGELNRSLLGEIGHTTVERDGPACFCGNRGCLEALCSVDRIVSQYRALRPDRPDIAFEEIVAAQRAGDPTAGRVLTECGEYLGIGLANVVNIFHPDRIIINSGAYAGCELIFRVAVDELKRRANSLLTRELEVERVVISGDDSCRGIALHLSNSIFETVFPL